LNFLAVSISFCMRVTAVCGGLCLLLACTQQFERQKTVVSWGPDRSKVAEKMRLQRLARSEGLLSFDAASTGKLNPAASDIAGA